MPEPREQFSGHRALAFGDSVMWGQGIDHNAKFCVRLARALCGVTMDTTAVRARSGAKLGSASDRSDGDAGMRMPVYGEIPGGDPSVYRQIATYGLSVPYGAMKTSDLPNIVYPDVELVLINGGINEFEASTLVTGDHGTLAAFEQRIDLILRRRFQSVLALARRRFPNALIVVPGYHFVFSQASMRGLFDVLRAVGPFNDHATGLTTQVRRGIRQCSWFMGLASTAQSRAVDRFNQTDVPGRGPGAIFVPSLHGPQHAAFGSASRSWGMRAEKPLGATVSFLSALFTRNWSDMLSLEPDDDVFALRRAAYAAYAIDIGRPLDTDRGTDASVHHASQFHPHRSHAAQVLSVGRQVHADMTRMAQCRSLRGLIGRPGDFLSDWRYRFALDDLRSLRRAFATHLISSIRLDGVVREGSSGDFNYSSLRLRLEMAGRSSPVTLRLNDDLPFGRGFYDGEDSVFPGPVAPRVGSGGITSNRPIDADTPVTFFAYPTARMSLFDLRGVEIQATTPGLRGAGITLENIRLTINGRQMPNTLGRAHVKIGERPVTIRL